eukprot:237887_1
MDIILFLVMQRIGIFKNVSEEDSTEEVPRRRIPRLRRDSTEEDSTEEDSTEESSTEAKQVPMDDDMYWFVFETKPFGMIFGKMTGDKKNLYVTAIDADSPGANGRVIVGSKVVAFESEYVEDMGAKKIFKTFSGKYAEVLPLKITFRKPEEAPQVEEEEVVQAAVVSKGLTQAVEEEEYEYYEEEEYEEE